MCLNNISTRIYVYTLVCIYVCMYVCKYISLYTYRLYNLPLVYECGKWVEWLSGSSESTARYIMSRLSQFIDYGHETDFEREIAISRASTIGNIQAIYLYILGFMHISMRVYMLLYAWMNVHAHWMNQTMYTHICIYIDTYTTDTHLVYIHTI